MGNVLELQGLCKSFGEKQVVRSLSLSMETGKLLCLLGPSGCGKTTTLQMIGGFLKPDAGSIRVDGVDITHLPPEARPVSTVFQSYALFPHLTVLGNVTYGLRFQKLRKREAEARGRDYLAMAGLSDCADARIHQLSGGQQQRVALVRSLITNPKVLLLDEPLSNLDAKLRTQLREELRDLQHRFDTTMVFVTHDQEEAMALSDQMAVMDGGVLQQLGTAEEVYRHPANDFVRDFLGITNRLTLPDGRAVALRPEQLRFADDGVLRGTVLRRSFFGFYDQYHIRIGDSEVLLRASGGEALPGDTVRLAVVEET
ncbi:MAG: ABC transporter ATP-binding protein [Oscillospiraceae bacterium]